MDRNPEQHGGVAMKWRQVSGLLLVVAGCIGVMTVADDLDHPGELFAVGGILFAGLVLLADGSKVFRLHGVPLCWVVVGIGAGEVVGAVVDRVPIGVGGGAVIGAIGSVIMALKQR